LKFLGIKKRYDRKKISKCVTSFNIKQSFSKIFHWFIPSWNRDFSILLVWRQHYLWRHYWLIVSDFFWNFYIFLTFFWNCIERPRIFQMLLELYKINWLHFIYDVIAIWVIPTFFKNARIFKDFIEVSIHLLEFSGLVLNIQFLELLGTPWKMSMTTWLSMTARLSITSWQSMTSSLSLTSLLSLILCIRKFMKVQTFSKFFFETVQNFSDVTGTAVFIYDVIAVNIYLCWILSHWDNNHHRISPLRT
jgi:hypothetical protein